MVNDKDGNLKPLMLSELIVAAQKAFDEYGDMIVWVQTSNVEAVKEPELCGDNN